MQIYIVALLCLLMKHILLCTGRWAERKAFRLLILSEGNIQLYNIQYHRRDNTIQFLFIMILWSFPKRSLVHRFFGGRDSIVSKQNWNIRLQSGQQVEIMFIFVVILKFNNCTAEVCTVPCKRPKSLKFGLLQLRMIKLMYFNRMLLLTKQHHKREVRLQQDF